MVIRAPTNLAVVGLERKVNGDSIEHEGGHCDTYVWSHKLRAEFKIIGLQ